MKDFVYGISALRRYSFGASATILAVMACMSLAAPEPAVVQRPNEWTVDVTFEHPQQIMLQLSGDKEPRRYWYADQQDKSRC
jgi:hypothetical protein